MQTLTYNEVGTMHELFILKKQVDFNDSLSNLASLLTALWSFIVECSFIFMLHNQFFQKPLLN